MLLNFFANTTSVGILVMLILSAYFIAINWLFFMRLVTLKDSVENEERAFHSVLNDNERVSRYSFMYRYISAKNREGEPISSNLLQAVKYTLTREASKGLMFLGIVASTAPFIGLFGTVVSILDTFSTLSEAELGAISVIAKGVSEALVATAVGIFVATFAYSYYQILKRKAYELIELISMQSELILFGNGSHSNMTTEKNRR